MPEHRCSTARGACSISRKEGGAGEQGFWGFSDRDWRDRERLGQYQSIDDSSQHAAKRSYTFLDYSSRLPTLRVFD